MLILNIFFIIFGVISVPFIWWYIHLSKYKSLHKIPGPKPLPFIGNVTELGQNPYELKINAMRLFKQYGSVLKLYIGSQMTLFISSPEWMEFIMSSSIHISKSKGYDLAKPLLGEGLLISNGNKWRQRRKMITPAFHFKILEQFIEIFNSAGNILIEKLSHEVDNVGFNIYPYINRCALDIICETAMGIKVNAQLNQNVKYVTTLQEFFEMFIMRLFSSWERFDFLFRMSPKYQQHEEYLNILHNFTNTVIEKQRQQLTERKLNNNNDDNNNDEGIKQKFALLDMLLQYESNNALTNEDIREEIDTFMFEGHDTVSSAISFAILALSRNPDIQQTVYEEILEIIGSNKNEFITTQHLQEMSYLDRVIKEILRMYPPAPLIERRIEKDCEFNGLKLKKDITVIMYIYALHHSEELYPNPEKFDPDRFLIENQSARHNYAYVPFSAGARNCIGKRFALLELKTTIIKIVRNFKILSVPGFKEQLGFLAILKSANGISVKLEKR